MDGLDRVPNGPATGAPSAERRATDPRPTARLRGWGSLLMRGESLVASWGLALAAILLVAMGAAGMWTLTVQRDAHRTLVEHSLGAAAASVKTEIGRLLAGGDLTAARSLVIETARDRGLASFRVLTGDGGVLADAAPSRIDVRELPDRLPPGPPPERVGVGGEDAERIVRRTPVVAGSRGMAFLELSSAAGPPMSAYWRVQGGIGLIGAAALSALLLVYRRMRGRFRGLGAVREALMLLGAGESSRETLAVCSEFGPEARAWNALLDELEKHRRDLIAERAKESLATRRDAGAELTQACDALWQGFIVIDDHGSVKFANGAAAAFLQVKRESMAGASAASLIRDERVGNAIRAVSNGQIKTRTLVEVRRAEQDGGGILRFSIRPVRRDDSASAIIMIEDITQQRVADEARNSFVAHATHELRTPLTNIRLYVEQAVDEGEKDPAVRARCLNVINQESRRLERIVGDMLSVSEIEAGSLKLRAGDVRLDALFQELESDFRAMAEEKRQTLKFLLPPKWPVVRGDRDKIVLALHNLLGNAVKYTPDGGAITVKVDVGEDKVVVDVVDTGFGVSEEESELIFEKFYRSKDGRVARITGTGLGLALAREVVRMHGGDITLKSQLNQGSTFTMTLPTRAAAA